MTELSTQQVQRVPAALEAPDDTERVIQSLLAASSPFIGRQFLDQVVQSLGTLFDADTTFLARRLDPASPMVRVFAAWKDGAHKESWDYDLTGNPCQIPYEGKPTLIPCDVRQRFEKKKDSNYESFIGLPLRGEGGEITGHIAIYNSRRIAEDPKWLNIAALFAGRVESELHRLLLEIQREDTIAQLEHTNAELDQVNRLKSMFLGTAAHDLRNPLGIIGAYAKLITSDAVGDLDIPEIANRITVATDRMVALIDSYLDVASIESGALTLETAPVPLETLVRERLDFLRSLARVKDIELVADLESIPLLELDALRFEQVIDNLVGNAIKYSPERSTVRIALRGTADAVELQFADQGPGISPAEMDKLFLPFVTGDAQATGNERSSGLGLAIVKRVITAHGGDIAVANAADAGAVFTLTLPKARPAAP